MTESTLGGKIRVVLDGDPGCSFIKAGRLVAIEDGHGNSISRGHWVNEGRFWYLDIPIKEE